MPVFARKVVSIYRKIKNNFGRVVDNSRHSECRGSGLEGLLSTLVTAFARVANKISKLNVEERAIADPPEGEKELRPSTRVAKPLLDSIQPRSCLEM
jgi:hypothetical protein